MSQVARESGKRVQGQTTSTGLRRGVSSKVDKILDLIDTGVMEALRRGFLKSLQFTIHEQKECPKDAIEIWLLDSSYAQDPSTGTRAPAAVKISEGENATTTITVERARASLISFIRKATDIASGLPELPESRYLTLSLHFNENCPLDYDPQGFPTEGDTPPNILGSNNLEKLSVATLDAGFHKVALLVGWTPDSPKDTKNAPQQKSTRDQPQSRKDRRPPSLFLPPSDTISPQEDVSHNSKSSGSLQKPQVAPNPSAARTGNLAPGSGAFMLSTSVIERMRAKCKAWEEDKPKMLENSHELDADGKVNCACNHNEPEGALIRCQCCGAYQHVNCYGFLGVADSRIPNIHICYTCLFDSEPHLEPRYLKQVANLAVSRRACFLLRAATYNGSAELTSALGCSHTVTGQLLKEFRRLEIMSSSPEKQAGRAQLTLLVDQDATRRMAEVYFKPHVGLESVCSQAAPTPPDTLKRKAEAHQTPRIKRPLSHMGLALLNSYSPSACPSTGQKR